MRDALLDVAENVVCNCLKVAPGEEIAIICDHDRLEIAESLAYAVLKRSATPIVLPIFEKSRSILSEMGKSLTVPDSVHALLDRVTVIITLIGKYVGELDFRRQILNHVKNNRCRIAHMPGIKPDQFTKYLMADFNEIERRGNELAVKLEQKIGKKLHITSKAGTDLTVIVTRHIHLSSGVIDKAGQLGNLPGGEVYFVPKEGSANGRLVIDISIPNLVLTETDEKIPIPISDGKVDLKGFQYQKNRLKEVLSKKGADVLCEVGIGLNDQIRQGTGTALIDEKMGGTVHVAFGDNTFFGGSNESSVHLDMVMQYPSLTIEGEKIMVHGKWKLAD
ncbi:MAG: aminopeptidase [Candidatus Hodarchaeota archaeon]